MRFVTELTDRILLFFFRKRLNLLIIKSFIGPFIISFIVVLVIFLVWQLLKYSDDFAGKGLEAKVYAEVVSYLVLSLIPRSLPLAIMLSSLITYGNLGQHYELTAIKSAGISLLKILMPTFLLVATLSVGSFYYSDNVLPWSNLKLYRLLYDIKTKDPAFNLKEGVFYADLEGYRIRVEKKVPESEKVYGIMIYDHTKGMGNMEVIVADSGTIKLDKSETKMSLHLFNGHRFSEETKNGRTVNQQFSRTDFLSSRIIIDMSELKMKDTPEELFSSNRFMLNVKQISTYSDSILQEHRELLQGFGSQIHEQLQFDPIDSSVSIVEGLHFGLKMTDAQIKQLYRSTQADASNLRYTIERKVKRIEDRKSVSNRYLIEMYHRYTEAIACVILFLIGAPVGAVLKKGGIGVPFVVTIVSFIIYYMLTITLEKYSRANTLHPILGGWGAVFILFPVGLFFLIQAYRDARLFEIDGYVKLFRKSKKET